MTNRRRDRRGRGLRGALAPPDSPLSVSRATLFDELVLDAVEHLEEMWAETLSTVEFAVEDVPPAPAGDSGGTELPVALGRSFPAHGERPARVVVYRRPIEGRAPLAQARGALVHDVVVELVAELLGLEPETVDPTYPEHDGWS